MTSTRGRFQFLALLTLATRYGDGGTNALHDSLGLTYKSGKRLPKAAEEIIQKQTEASQSPTDIDSADPKDLSNFAEDKRRMIDQALAAVGDEPDVSVWLFHGVRELNRLKTDNRCPR